MRLLFQFVFGGPLALRKSANRLLRGQRSGRGNQGEKVFHEV